jgi:hypothetical protein
LHLHLDRNKQALSELGIDYIGPPHTRKQMLRGLMKIPAKRTEKSAVEEEISRVMVKNKLKSSTRANNARLFLSEENLLGSMRNNRNTHTLYPDLEARLDYVKPAFEPVDMFYLCIRELPAWWVSCLQYTIRTYASPPGPDELEAITDGARTWKNVIQDIRAAYPHTKLVIREFGYEIGNINAQLEKVTGWTGFDVLPMVDKIPNAALPVNELQAIVAQRGDLAGAKALAGQEKYQPFSTQQLAHLEGLYRQDLEWISAQDDAMIRYLGPE